MRVTILTQGSRGDVQPCVALGVGLQQAGHQVKVATHQLFEKLVCDNGLDFVAIGGDPSEWHKQDEWTQTSGRGFGWVKADSERLLGMGKRQMDQLWQACQGSDLILWVPLFVVCARMAEALGIPSIGINAYPFSPTSTFACPWTFGRWLEGPGAYNWLTWVLSHQLYWQLLRQMVNDWFRENLQRSGFSWIGPYHEVVERQKTPILYGFSPSLLPKPKDWPDWFHVTGCWFLDPPANWSPPTDLVEFLAAGPPPIYIGFGSIASDRPGAMTELVLKALALTGQRGILDVGWGGMAVSLEAQLSPEQTDNVFWIKGVLHDWLFPQVASVVHHGGAGTTSTGIRAGTPTIILPTFGDQFLWGQQIVNLGLGSARILKNQLTAERLASAINTSVNSQTIRETARDFSRKLRAEDGVNQAVKLLHRYVENWQAQKKT